VTPIETKPATTKRFVKLRNWVRRSKAFYKSSKQNFTLYWDVCIGVSKKPTASIIRGEK